MDNANTNVRIDTDKDITNNSLLLIILLVGGDEINTSVQSFLTLIFNSSRSFLRSSSVYIRSQNLTVAFFNVVYAK